MKLGEKVSSKRSYAEDYLFLWEYETPPDLTVWTIEPELSLRDRGTWSLTVGNVSGHRKRAEDALDEFAYRDVNAAEYTLHLREMFKEKK